MEEAEERLGERIASAGLSSQAQGVLGKAVEALFTRITGNYITRLSKKTSDLAKLAAIRKAAIPYAEKEISEFVDRFIDSDVRERRNLISYALSAKAAKRYNQVKRMRSGTGLLGAKAVFTRKVKEITQELRDKGVRFQLSAMLSLQEIVEREIANMFEIMIPIAMTEKVLTLRSKHLWLADRIVMDKCGVPFRGVRR